MWAFHERDYCNERYGTWAIRMSAHGSDDWGCKGKCRHRPLATSDYCNSCVVTHILVVVYIARGVADVKILPLVG